MDVCGYIFFESSAIGKQRSNTPAIYAGPRTRIMTKAKNSSRLKSSIRRNQFSRWFFIEVFFFKYRLQQSHQSIFVLITSTCALTYHLAVFSWAWACPYSASISVWFFVVFVLICALAQAVIMMNSPHHIPNQDIPAIRFWDAEKNSPYLSSQLQRHAYRDIIVVQRIAFDTLQPLAQDILDPWYRLETIEERQTSPGKLVRISKVLEIHIAENQPMKKKNQ